MAKRRNGNKLGTKWEGATWEGAKWEDTDCGFHVYFLVITHFFQTIA